MIRVTCADCANGALGEHDCIRCDRGTVEADEGFDAPVDAVRVSFVEAVLLARALGPIDSATLLAAVRVLRGVGS